MLHFNVLYSVNAIILEKKPHDMGLLFGNLSFFVCLLNDPHGPNKDRTYYDTVADLSYPFR